MGACAILSLLLAAVPLSAQPADALADFAPGQYAANPIGTSGLAHRACIADVNALVTGGRPFGSCRFVRVGGDAAQTVISWRCAGGTSGRTAIRRDSAGVYTVHQQGIADGLPFAEHAEWRRIGPC